MYSQKMPLCVLESGRPSSVVASEVLQSVKGSLGSRELEGPPLHGFQIHRVIPNILVWALDLALELLPRHKPVLSATWALRQLCRAASGCVFTGALGS